jgi:hypothetical protein
MTLFINDNLVIVSTEFGDLIFRADRTVYIGKSGREYIFPSTPEFAAIAVDVATGWENFLNDEDERPSNHSTGSGHFGWREARTCVR